tara:strand:- start:205 stop:606 length:402 start_codon:yes stop_codon:yes gene_type:complete
MRPLLAAPLLFTFLPPVNAGIYFYPSYSDGIEVRCKDGKPNHLVEITKAGRGIKLKGHGDDQYSWPITYLFPEASDDKYKYFPSTAGTQCSFRKLNEKEKNSLILKAFKTCVGTEVDMEIRLERRKKYCFGWN